MPPTEPKNSSFPMNSSRQLVDSLTSHLSLYHSVSPNANCSSNPNPRSSIIKWFSSLSVTQRQAHLTVVDWKFTQTLLEMIRKIESNGHGFFFVLPDIPRNSAAGDCTGSLPSLLYRKSHGLLSRVAESNESELLIRESTCLFSSKEGENVKQTALLGNDECVDTMTVSEDFVENVERFVEIMDGVSGREFLRGDDNGGLVVEWVEMEWLKAKGYYSMEVFVANRLEVAMRLAWLNSCNSGKKKGVRLKEKVHAAGLSVNVFWRKKGCIDWWQNLDKETKGKLLRIAIGKAAKCLSTEVLKGERDKVWQWICKSKQSPRCKDQGNSMLQQSGAEGRLSISCKSDCRSSSSLKSMLRGLIILQDISSMLLMLQQSVKDEKILFYSSVKTVTTPFDCVMRKFRELLMVISLDCTKYELLGEGNTNSITKKQKEKPSSSKQKKKAKNCNLKKPTSVTRSPEDESKFVKPTKDNSVEFLDRKSVDASWSGKLADKPQENKLRSEPFLSAVDKGCCKRVSNEKSASALRKGRKERKKAKHSSSQRLVEVGKQRTSEVDDVCVNADSQNKASKNDWLAEHSNAENVSSSKAFGNAEECSNLECCQCTTEGTNLPVLKDCHVMDIVVADNEAAASVESIDYHRNFCATSSTVSVELDKDPTGSNGGSVNSDYPVEVTKSGFREKLSKEKHVEEKFFQIPENQRAGLYDIGILNSSVYLSYEWPTVTPLQLPPNHSHMPAATDRLHLDVGHNWQNHFHQSFVPAERRVRNPSGENGCMGIVSRPLTMSSDWPPTVRSMNGLAPSVACNYDSGFFPRRQTFQQGFSSPSVQHTAVTTDDDKLSSGDLVDFSDPKKSQELADEQENYWMSEEELEVHAVPGMDYNQYFGGGVMYWNPSDYPGSNFSRPPSRSSDDSSWAWREADMNRAVDDMVAISSSYSTNGLTSPSAASFCSIFDPLGPGHQAVGYVLSESEISSKVLHSSSTIDVKEDNASGAISNLSVDGEVKTGESHPYPILRPIIIPVSRERSRSDIKRSHDHKSPCVPLSGREHPRIKRPPSPVVLCVPRAPRPPPPSPVNDARKQRGYPTARSGSSSPRQWGVKGWSSDVISFEEACVHMDGSEVVWPSWRNKGISVHQLTQPVPGALLQDRLIAISQLSRDQEHPDISLPLQPPESLMSTRKASLSVIHSCLNEEIDVFCKQVTAENIIRKPYISWAVKRVTRSLQVLWPRSRTNIFGSNATGLSLPSSDVDLVVCLPPVRNLEPIKEAGILEGRNGIKETCLQHAARYLANQEWVKNDSLKIVENTAIPIIMLVVEVPRELISTGSLSIRPSKEESLQSSDVQRNSFQDDSSESETYTSPNCFQIHTEAGRDVKSVRIDISFKSPSHTGLQTTELVKGLAGKFPAATPLALVLKKFLADRSLDQSYSGGLSSYCLVLLVVRFLQHEHHLGRPINQNYGSLLMDFLYFFGNVFDPREMRVSVQGSGVYVKREPGCSIDPIYIADPLFPTNNVGRNCFRIHQCIKAFADAYSTLESEPTYYPGDDEDLNTKLTSKLLPKIIPSIGHFPGS